MNYCYAVSITRVSFFLIIFRRKERIRNKKLELSTNINLWKANIIMLLLYKIEIFLSQLRFVNLYTPLEINIITTSELSSISVNKFLWHSIIVEHNYILDTIPYSAFIHIYFLSFIGYKWSLWLNNYQLCNYHSSYHLITVYSVVWSLYNFVIRQ